MIKTKEDFLQACKIKSNILTCLQFTLPEDIKAQMQKALDEVNKEIDNYLEKHGGVVL